MFAIGDKKWPGISKLMEEFGEVLVVCGKLMGSRGEIKHWSGNLLDMLHDEVGDAQAAIWFVIDHCGLQADRITKRARMKYDRYVEWHTKHDPLPDGTIPAEEVP